MPYVAYLCGWDSMNESLAERGNSHVPVLRIRVKVETVVVVTEVVAQTPHLEMAGRRARVEERRGK